MKNLRTKTVGAAGWVLGSRVISQVISFGFGIALARLLVPDDFGLIAMALVFTRLANLLSDVGLGAALVQKKDAREEHFYSVFWINTLLGCAIALMLFLISPLLASFYERPEIENISKVLSISFIVGAVTLVPRSRFAKELLFKHLSLIDLTAMVVSGSIAVVMASSGFGYWSLVVNTISQQFISAVLIWIVSGWRPKMGISRIAVIELFGFSVSVFGTNFIQYVAKNADKMLLGKFMGGQSLGLYDKAHSMMLFPLQNVSRVIGSVMFPSLSLIQSDTMRVRDIYLRCIRAIALITFPMMAGMFVVADSFVLGVLGHQWSELVPVLRILCIAGIAASIVTVTGALYQSQGAASLQFRVNLITQPISIVAVIAGLPWGTLGVAAGYTVALFFNSIITLAVAGRLVDLRFSTLVRSLAPILPPALIMAVSVWAIRPFLGMTDELPIFFVQVVAGGCIYFACVVTMRVRAYQDVLGVLRDEFVARKDAKG